ncbi:hypothetical protein B0J14DRAFT_675170 [Halenospora varia]|nr:hypothetical protein B0J14DRAFT_675170 [Halenospora varia]
MPSSGHVVYESPCVIFTTGSGSIRAGNGIGLSIVRGLLDDARTSLIVAVDLIATSLEPLRTKSRSRLEIIIGDVSDRSTSERAVERAISLRGQLDTIILNAGILRPSGPLVQTKVDDWKRLFDVNFFSLVHTVQLAIPHLRLSRGKIIMTSSAVSLFPYKEHIPYGCAKATMNYLCSVLAVDEPYISTMCITPGIVETGMQKQIRDECGKIGQDQLEHLQKHQNGKNLNPDQPAKTYVALTLGTFPQNCNGKVVEWNDPSVCVQE